MKRWISGALSLILALCLCMPFLASAASSGSSASNVLYDQSFCDAWDNNAYSLLVPAFVPVMRSWLDSIVSEIGVGELSPDALFRGCGLLNARFHNPDIVDHAFKSAFVTTFGHFNFSISSHPQYGLVIVEQTSGLTLCNSKGAFPYAKEVIAGETPGGLGGQWVREDKMSTTYNVVSEAVLADLLDAVNASSDEKGRIDTLSSQYKAIVSNTTVSYRRMFYCDEKGRPYVAQISSDRFAVNQSNNYYTEVNENQNNQTNNNVNIVDQGTTENNLLIDVDNNAVWFPNGTLNYINQLLYDESTKTYYVDSHDSYTWNSTTNNYTSNFYNIRYEFHINYTSVTYIGTTAEYDETYELYYQLPDGRSSADLTAEDLEQLSLVFADVVNYKRSADDVSQRALYHFDGDTQDSSYWSYCSDFHWDAGASLTYMDEGTFGGSLYLDETAHDFTLTLPNNDAAADFTLQFRYYQSYTAAPQTDSTLSLGGVAVLKWDGAKYYTGTGTVICATSIGAWNEICIMRKNSVLYYYINGVYYTSVSNGGFMGSTVRFQFGANQQTYKKLDELRFTKGAIYSGGQNYQPMAVPYDTNLALVLPDKEVPIADEYFVLNPGENNLLDSLGFSDWSVDGIKSKLDYGYPAGSSRSVFFCTGSAAKDYISYIDGATHVAFPGVISFYDAYGDGSLSYYLRAFTVRPGDLVSSGISYCFSVVLSDGSYSYIVFSLSFRSFLTSFVVNSSFAALDTGTCTYSTKTSKSTYPVVTISSVDGSPLDIVYMELVQGDKPSFSLEWYSAVYSSGQLEDAPVLAVRSNLNVTAYQIGGVRPSYPTRGQVWALVENNRITSLQQYNGSAWVAVDGRIWTGERWIPYSSFDVFTLKDCYDIADSSGEDYEYIYTETGFWSWWQKSWKAFTGKLDGWMSKILAAITGSSNGTDPDDPDDPNDPAEDEADYKGIVKLLRDSYGFFSGFFSDFTVGGINGFISFFTDDNSDVYGILSGIDWSG